MGTEHDEDWGELRAEIRSLNTNVSRLTEVVDENTKQLSKVEILEVHNNIHNKEIERAFSTLKELKEVQVTNMESQSKKNSAFDRYVWTATGFVLAVCCFWTLIGYRIQQQIDESLKTIAEFRIHIIQDRLLDYDDIRKTCDVNRSQQLIGGKP